MDDHDTSYRLLFSHPEMVRDLLLGFVPGEWVRELDFDSLEKMNGSYVTDDLRSRHADTIWRVRWGSDWLYIYLLLEFQSTVDRYMPVRILSYTSLLYQDLIKQKALGEEGRLPPVLPIVLYNGEARWRAPTRLADLVQGCPAGLEGFQPDQAFLLLDEGAFDPDALSPLHNLVAALFRLEHRRSLDEVTEVLALLLGPVDTQSIGPVEPENAPIKAQGSEFGGAKRLTSNAERRVFRLNPKGWPCFAAPLR